MAGELKWLVLAAALATTGCGEESPELIAMKIELNALKHEMEYLRLQTEDLDPRVHNAEQMALQVLDEREAPLRLDCLEHRPGIVLTRLAPITAVCEGVVRIADGYRLRLKLGNPTSARLDGVRLTLYAGDGAAQGRADTRMHFEARAALPPGEWTTLEVDLGGVPERATSDLALRAQIDTMALRAVDPAPAAVRAARGDHPIRTLTIALPIPISAAPEISPAQIGSSPSTQ